MPLSPAALEPLLRLALVPGIGPNRLTMLARRFGSAERVLAASRAELAAVAGVGDELVRRLRAASEPAAVERVSSALSAMERMEAVALTPDDLSYPESFRVLADPPYLLFAAGDLTLLGERAVAVVGTRQPTDYGRRAAAELSAGLARAGYVVVSGMARGIDAAAHSAALDAEGGTIGVLGHGIDRVYPAENRTLFRRVRQSGLLLTEFPPGEQPRAGNFPRRNRLIAALGAGVLVVEMGARSGAQHTVNYATEQGKEIFAVPGPIASAVSAGTNQLIKDGARVVTSVDDILEELEGVGRPAARQRTAADAVAASPEPSPPELELSPEEARALAALTGEPRHVDDLSAASELPPQRLLAALLALELRGSIESLPGKQFRRV